MLNEVNFNELIEDYNKDGKRTNVPSKVACLPANKYSAKEKSTGPMYLQYKKAYNLGIILGGLKKPVAAIVEGLRQFDDDTITPEVVTHLLQYGPDEEEAKQLLLVSEPDTLEKPDFLAYELIRLPMYLERLKAMLLRSTLDERIEDVRKSINVVIDACLTLKNSKNVKDVIELENMRIKNKQVSVMNLLLRLTKKQFNKYPNMQQEIRLISAASSVDICHIDEEVRKLSNSVSEAESTVCKIRQYEQISSSDVFVTKMSVFLGEAAEKLMRLKQDNCRVKEMFTDVRKYFGDDNKDTSSEKFFTTFKCFLTKFQTIPLNNAILGVVALEAADFEAILDNCSLL